MISLKVTHASACDFELPLNICSVVLQMSESSFDRSFYTTVNPPHSRKREEFIVRWNLARCPVKCLPGTCLPCPSLANLP